MKLLLSSLLLASHCALSSWSVSSGTVTQSPDVSVTEGETVNITCCWTLEFVRIRVNWLKIQTDMNQTNISEELFSFENHSQGSLQKDTSNCSHLTFTNVTSEHSGRYICRVTVEIPLLIMVNGSGTVITVTAGDATKDNDSGDGRPASTIAPLLPVITSLAVVVPLLLISLVCFCTVRRRKAQAARVIYEVPHFNSEEAEMDKHSTSSSRGSSQWCQVPVYESVDYFERVEDKGQPPVQKTEANVEVP